MKRLLYTPPPPSAVWLDPPWHCPPSRATSTLMALTATIQPPSRSWAPVRACQSGSTGALATFGTCASCITGISTTYNPFSGPVNNFLSGTNGAISFALDLLSVFNVQFVPNNDLDFDGAAVLHLTNFADTPGEIFFSSQGSGTTSRSRSARPPCRPLRARRHRDPGCRPVGVGLRRQPPAWPRPRYRRSGITRGAHPTSGELTDRGGVP